MATREGTMSSNVKFWQWVICFSVVNEIYVSGVHLNAVELHRKALESYQIHINEYVKNRGIYEHMTERDFSITLASLKLSKGTVEIDGDKVWSKGMDMRKLIVKYLERLNGLAGCEDNDASNTSQVPSILDDDNYFYEKRGI